MLKETKMPLSNRRIKDLNKLPGVSKMIIIKICADLNSYRFLL